MLPRRSVLIAAAALVIVLGACGGDGGATRVTAGSGSATSAPASVETTPVETTPVGTTPAPTSVETTSPPGAPASSDAPSPVDGLDAGELQAALAAPVVGTARSAGPTLDQVVLADGTTVWRVRIAGRFPARSARVAVSVGERKIGVAVLAADLSSLTAATTDGTGLTPGLPVTYQWEGGPVQPAGALVVLR